VPEISVVIPAYNEEAIIEQVVQEAIAALRKARLDSFEVVLVDDGSTDHARSQMEQVRRQFDCIRVAFRERNRGLGAALRTGFGAASGRVVTWIPGDGESTPLELIELSGEKVEVCHFLTDGRGLHYVRYEVEDIDAPLGEAECDGPCAFAGPCLILRWLAAVCASSYIATHA
jgi:glycosyltransferase involved in cell wall biosynthesis